jgi:hypothetical protein
MSVENPGCTSGASNAQRLLVADLSAIHRQRVAECLYKPEAFAGQHSDIYFEEIYSIIAGFLGKTSQELSWQFNPAVRPTCNLA